MQSLSKFNLNGGLKRLVSTLICVMMVLATFPMHMLEDTVSAAGEDSINLTLGDEKDEGATVGNGSEVSNWMNGQLANLAGKDNINITLSNDITVTDANNKMSETFFFNFTEKRFAGKTITIDGKGHTIKIDNANLFFLNLKDCKVILKNIIIGGGWNGLDDGLSRSGSFINVASPTGGSESKLEIDEGTTIQNCKNSASHGGAINIREGGKLEINGGNIINCIAYTPPRSSSYYCGGAISIYRGTLTINGGNIIGCTGYAGGAIDGCEETTTINGGNIVNCTASPGSSSHGGAIRTYKGTVTINGGSIIGCSATGVGGAISNQGTVIINGESIIGCSSSSTYSAGDAISTLVASGGVAAPLYLPPKEFGFLTITLPIERGNGMGYEGIIGDFSENPNRKVVFVDSESNSTVGFVFKKLNDDISVPDRPRPGYKLADLSYTKADGTKGTISLANGQFTLTQEVLDTAVSGVVTLYVNYDKPYTVQYVYADEVVGVKSGCSVKTELGTIINNTFSNITLDDGQKLADVVKPGEGCTFLNFTYGDG